MHDWLALVRARLAPWTGGSLAASELDEVAQHVAEQHADLVASGVPDDDAVERALAPLDLEGARLVRSIRARMSATAPVPPPTLTTLTEGIARDLLYAARQLARARGFTTAAVLTLAIAIAANTAIFSIVDAVLLRPIPLRAADRLAMIGERAPDGAGNVGFLTFLDWKQRTHSFEEMAVVRPWSPTLVTNGEPERIGALRVSANYFRLLGVAPALGRDFAEEEDTPARWHLVVISDALWKRRFAADPSVVGRPLAMNDQQYTIIGVLPSSFAPLVSEHFYERADMWALVGYDGSLPYACRTCQHLKALARLKPGVTLEAARADLDGVQQQLVAEHAADYVSKPMAIVPLRQVLTGSVRPALVALMGAVGLVLLIACANVANLQMARVAERRHDLALRTALGATRLRLVQQLLAESTLIAAGGAFLGWAAAAAAVPALASLAPERALTAMAVRFDAHVFWFTISISAATAILFGLMPALHASRIDESMASLQADRGRTRGVATTLGRRALIAADIAIAVVLLAGAGLMVRSIGRLLGVNPGFDPSHVLTMQVSMLGKRYVNDSAVVTTGDAIRARLRQLPGVHTVALAGQIPLGGNGDRWSLRIEGRPSGPDEPAVERYSVTPEYFAAMRIPLVRGRLIDDRDRAESDRVMLIGEQTARTLFAESDPIGQRVKIGGEPTPWRKIVGLVGDVHHEALSAPPTMQMYTPQAQLTDSFLTVVIRADSDAPILASEARRAIWSVASDVPVYQVTTLEELVRRSVAPRRFVELLLELFAAAALVMTSVGIYGLVSASVSERTREIGIRSALGASPAGIVGLVATSGIPVVAAGLVAGVVAALAATRYLKSSLYGVSPADVPTFAASVGILAAVALVAQLVPTVRALRVDPTVALRQE
jgi:putative ABC transport system permease protein